MAEEDVHYAAVVFKNKKQPQSKPQKGEETVYGEVKVQNETAQQTSDSKGLLSEKEAERRRRNCQTLACCLGTFFIILVLGIIVTVYLLFFHKKELNELKANQLENKNLTALNSKLRSDYENLTDQIHNLTQVYNVLEIENKNLTATNTELEGDKKSLKEQIKNLQDLQDLQDLQNELNVSRAQWSIDAYCRKETTERKCNPCEKGWDLFLSSCYAYNNAERLHQKTWDEAQENCTAKASHLTVVANQEEKNYVDKIIPDNEKIKVYWIGLRAVQGKWKWIDGTELTNQDWIGHNATDGQCVTSLQNQGWRSVGCGEKNAWICEKKAVSVN